MTGDEAVQGAVERHGLRQVKHIWDVGEFVAYCYCGLPSARFPTREQAEFAHERHRQRAAGQMAVAASFQRRRHP